MKEGYIKKAEALRLKNQKGPSGVPFGGIGAGYFEINPDGKMSRTCHNNIHKQFIDFPEGMFLALYEKTQDGEPLALRLQKDDENICLMGAFSESYYLGLFPVADFSFKNPVCGRKNCVNHEVTVFSGVIPNDAKNSSLPAAFYEITLTNTSDSRVRVSAAISAADIISRGIRDTDRFAAEDFATYGDSADWYFMKPVDTRSAITQQDGWKGIRQYAADKNDLFPNKMTLQNYNDEFSVIAEQGENCEITYFGERSIDDNSEWERFVSTGKFSCEDKMVSNENSDATKPSKCGAVAISTFLDAGEKKTLRFISSWFASKPDYDKINCMPEKAFRKGLDYGHFYNNFFEDITELNRYLIKNREMLFEKTVEWQIPVLESNIPDWLKLKIINSGYTLFTNCVLTESGCFSSLEGEMGGLGGTMDQKMCSHPFYQKFFYKLDCTENEQFADNPSSEGQISHMDIMYYDGINRANPGNADRVWDGGSMVDNTGAWLLQMLKSYDQTGDDSYIKKNYNRINAAMRFMKGKCNKYGVPMFGTTYDDATHPEIFIFSATVYLLMLKMAARAAEINGDGDMAGYYRSQAEITYDTIGRLYISEDEEHGYYSIGADPEMKTLSRDVIFSGLTGGQFLSRYCGWGDILPFENMTKSVYKLLTTSVQSAKDYYAPKIYNLVTEQSLDNPSSSCWPFYHDCYVGMGAIQQGYAEDGLKIIEHTQKVHMRNGWLWSQNLWSPNYCTYMTAPVMWFFFDVLAGAAVDVNNHRLTLGPTVISADKKLDIPLFYPKFWARLKLDADKKTASLEITKTIGEEKYYIDTLVGLPNGVPESGKKTAALKKPFEIKSGAVLDLTGYYDIISGFKSYDSVLEPVGEFDGFPVERMALGNGFKAWFYSDSDFKCLSEERKDVMTRDMPKEARSAVFRGNIIPRYSQEYTLFLKYSGGARLTVNGKVLIDDLENTCEKETPVKLNMNSEYSYLTVIEYVSGVENDIRLYWWSTTQTRDEVMRQRIMPALGAYENISIADYSYKTPETSLCGDTLAEIRDGSYVSFNGLDFAGGADKMKFKIYLATPREKGKIELRADSVNGPLLSELEITKTGLDWWDYVWFEAEVTQPQLLKGYKDIYIISKTDDDYLANIRAFTFEKTK